MPRRRDPRRDAERAEARRRREAQLDADSAEFCRRLDRLARHIDAQRAAKGGG